MKTMVITGASSGLGKAVAEHFAKKNFAVCAIARSTEKLKKLEDQYSENIVAYPADISDKKQVKNVFNKILEKHKVINILVNNAAVRKTGDFHEQEIDLIDEIIDTNLKGTMYCTHYALPAMIEKGKGEIINIASVGGLVVNPQAALYCSSKHGMIGFGEAIAKAMCSKGVRVTTLCPGGIDTPLWTKDSPHPGGAEKLMTPKDIAKLIGFIIKQPNNVLYKRVVFFPMCEWA